MVADIFTEGENNLGLVCEEVSTREGRMGGDSSPSLTVCETSMGLPFSFACSVLIFKMISFGDLVLLGTRSVLNEREQGQHDRMRH